MQLVPQGVAAEFSTTASRNTRSQDEMWNDYKMEADPESCICVQKTVGQTETRINTH